MLELLEGKKEQKKGGQPTNRSASKIHRARGQMETGFRDRFTGVL
jgi:hypothetical protein